MSNRFRMLNVQHVFLGVEHKLATLKNFLEANQDLQANLEQINV